MSEGKSRESIAIVGSPVGIDGIPENRLSLRRRLLRLWHRSRSDHGPNLRRVLHRRAPADLWRYSRPDATGFQLGSDRNVVGRRASWRTWRPVGCA